MGVESSALLWPATPVTEGALVFTLLHNTWAVLFQFWNTFQFLFQFYIYFFYKNYTVPGLAAFHAEVCICYELDVGITF